MDAQLRRNAQNAKSLEAINRAALVVCLDGGVADAEPYEVAWPRQVCRGGPNAEHAANRWWDKPVQVIVGEDGGSALVYDHTAFDGTVMTGVTNHCYDYAYTGDTERLIYQFPNYGKKFIQSCNMSPDGYAQMAIQLAASRTIGTPVMVYGTASTRQFLHGRATVYYSSSEDSLSFCRDFDSPLSSRAEKEQSLRKAVERCKQDAVSAANGLAVYRMVYGLLSIALDDGIPIHPFFKHRVFGRADLTASQVNLQCDGCTFANPSFPGSYMVIYNIRPESFIFGLSCSKSFPERNTTKFKDAIEKALTELRECVDKCR
ncbi:carnitine acyltransferase, putative [Ixodes scapularis]|uniref:Carnitine acyltransferase, putative n=1 Tax=Ixodes scapularis TaxID=6945 RepID=B7Q2W7_IXOSC|nr:carnitine acyltransferase, putative [Ixodes scapularis]|eukprot:XP_002411065.1 carnitine acyltransferase, putative [Ixodes scapularis]